MHQRKDDGLDLSTVDGLLGHQQKHLNLKWRLSRTLTRIMECMQLSIFNLATVYEQMYVGFYAA